MLFDQRRGEQAVQCGASIGIVPGPQPAAMRGDDGPGDREPEAESFGLVVTKGSKSRSMARAMFATSANKTHDKLQCGQWVTK